MLPGESYSHIRAQVETVRANSEDIKKCHQVNLMVNESSFETVN